MRARARISRTFSPCSCSAEAATTKAWDQHSERVWLLLACNCSAEAAGTKAWDQHSERVWLLFACRVLCACRAALWEADRARHVAHYLSTDRGWSTCMADLAHLAKGISHACLVARLRHLPHQAPAGADAGPAAATAAAPPTWRASPVLVEALEQGEELGEEEARAREEQERAQADAELAALPALAFATYQEHVVDKAGGGAGAGGGGVWYASLAQCKEGAEAAVRLLCGRAERAPQWPALPACEALAAEVGGATVLQVEAGLAAAAVQHLTVSTARLVGGLGRWLHSVGKQALQLRTSHQARCRAEGGDLPFVTAIHCRAGAGRQLTL